MEITIDRLLLAEIDLPAWHPRARDGRCLVFGYAVRHPDGVIVFDTGVGTGDPLIDELYHPAVVPIAEALAAIGVDERDVIAVVNSHLHFDHCGQNASLSRRGVPVYVAAAEVAAATSLPHYTVPEWAHVPPAQLRRVHGDEPLADGVRIVETPGHTPGHQSLVVDDGHRRTVLAGQCVYKLAEIADRRVAADNIHDAGFAATAQESLERLLALEPRTVVAAHDPGTYGT